MKTFHILMLVTLVAASVTSAASDPPDLASYTEGLRMTLEGFKYLDGREVLENHARAFECFKKASSLGDAGAQEMLSKCYEFGDGTAKNDPMAWRILFKLSNEGNRNGQLALAQKYYHAYMLEQHPLFLQDGPDRATEYFIQAYKWACLANLPASKEWMAASFPSEGSVDPSLRELVKAATEPHLAAVERIRDLASDLRQLMADWVNEGWVSKLAIVKAQQLADTFHAVPVGPLKFDPPAAKNPVIDIDLVARTVAFQKQRAESGSAQAQYDLGLRFLSGDGVEKDESAGKAWLQKAAKQDFAAATLKLKQIDGAQIK
jgi:TPR repeat protein